MKRILLPALCAGLLVGCDARNPVSNLPGASAALAASGVPGSPAGAPVAGTSSNAVPFGVASATNPVPGVATSSTNPVPAVAAGANGASATNGTAVAASPAPRLKPVPDLPPPAAQVIQLSQTTLGDSVLLNFIEGIREPFTLNADQVIYLSDLGMGTPVLNALLRKAAASPAVTAGPVQNVVVQVPDAATAAPGAGVAGAAGLAPAENVLLTNYLASTAAGPATGYPGGPQPAAPAPVYGEPIPGAQPAPPPPATAAVGVPVGTTVTYNTFYEQLSPYGSWVQLEPYGWCWQPTVVVVNPSWQPYCDGGSWLWSDHGWYWQSSYSWGWAPFHYGRWHRASRHGWVWTPGCDWGPAWVSWRQNSSYCGWAPLPPECHWSVGVGFSWRSRGSSVSVGFGIYDDWWFGCGWNNFCDTGLPRHRLGRDRMQPFLRDSRQIIAGDNSVNVIGNNNTVIINNGVSKDDVQRHSRGEIRKVALRDASSPDQATQRVPTGNNTPRPEVAAYRPRLTPESAQPSAPPAAVLARQESRKNGDFRSTGSGGQLPSRPGTVAPGNSGFVGTAPAAARPQAGLANPSGGLTPAVGNPGYSRPGTGTLPARRPEAPAATPIGRGTAPAGNPNAGLVPARGGAGSLSSPLYQQPSRPSPGVTPARPSVAPGTAVPGRPAVSSPGQGPAVRQDPIALNRVPTARPEPRKPETASGLYGRPAPSAVGGNPAGGGGSPAPRYEAPSRPATTYSAPAARPAPAIQPRENFQSRPSYQPTPVTRPEPRSYSPAPAPAPRSYQPAPSPAPSRAPAPAPAPTSRPDPGRGQGGGGGRARES